MIMKYWRKIDFKCKHHFRGNKMPWEKNQILPPKESPVVKIGPQELIKSPNANYII